jgi:predicted DNA-binding protein (MmcQ/YjbR family)
MNYPWLYAYLKEKPGATQDFKEEWQWTRFLVGGKMFAAICKGDAGEDALITLKLRPEDGVLLRQRYSDIVPGYYMNKVHWNSICANSNMVPEELVRWMADQSYELVFHSLPKRTQRELLGEI